MVTSGAASAAGAGEAAPARRCAALLAGLPEGFRARWIADLRLLSLPARVPPWTDTGVALAAGEALTLLASGRVVLSDLTWLWSAALPVGAAFACPLPTWHARETHLVARSGHAGLGVWQAETRRVLDDWRTVTGSAPPAPPRLGGSR